MKLNLGCGFHSLDGFLNVDRSSTCQPNLVFNAETQPWPWETNSVDEVVFHHSLEHMGASADVFLGMIRELYRVCTPDARVRITVPHPRHDNFINDPTHVRAITPEMLGLFDLEKNKLWVKGGYANSPLAMYLGVDFSLESSVIVLLPAYEKKVAAGELSSEAIWTLLTERNNIATEYRMVLVARKPVA